LLYAAADPEKANEMQIANTNNTIEYFNVLLLIALSSLIDHNVKISVTSPPFLFSRTTNKAVHNLEKMIFFSPT